MQRRSSPKQRATDKAVLAFIAQWGGMHKPDGMTGKAWGASLRRLSAAGLITFERGWRIK